MSDNNVKFGTFKSSEVPRINESSNSPWVVGISKSHPGQKYFFNTVTGVSRWHISSDEIERCLPHLKPNGSQCQYVNCPEPKEPPPNRRNLMKHFQHTLQCPKVVSREVANVFPRQTAGITCEVCCSPVNQLSINFRQRVGDPECTSLLNNTLQSQVVSTASPFNVLSCESNYGCGKSKYLLERKTFCSGESPDITVQDATYYENTHNQTENDGQWLETSTHLEMLDVSPLKILAQSGCIDDKWYIVADVSVYLHSLQLLRTLLNSDQQCCLMVPQYVKVELENATKTQQKTKAYCANYFLYKLIDDGVAIMDEDSNLQLHKDKLDKENIINCCIKLTNQNFFVILITNDIQLKKFRHKINIPVFTVKELKDYLCRNSYLITSPSPESSVIDPHSKNITPLCATTSNKCYLNDTTIPNKHNTTVVKLDKHKNLQTSLFSNYTEKQIDPAHNAKRTVEAGMQTDLSLTQLEEMENVYKKTYLSDQSYDKVKDKGGVLCQSFGSLLSSTNRGSRKHIKLRRRKVTNQVVSADPVSSSETQNNVNSSNEILQKTRFAPMPEHNGTHVGDKSKNAINCFLEPPLHNTVQNQSNLNDNSTCPTEEISNNCNKVVNKSFEKTNVEGNNEFHKICSPTSSNEESETFQNENVMFEVTNTIMEENLKRKCDEWVSRFVQIMEEALTQVLRKTSSLCLPPPWNIYEATLCIRQKYKDDADVLNASTKLLNILNCLSGIKGNSNVNISPNKFMELYSFGVYLIDALQGIFSTCEDLQIAAGSLTKLLSDIQSPELDMSNIESFGDVSQEDNVLNDNEYSSNNTATVNNSSVSKNVNIENLPENNINEIGLTNNHTVSPKNLMKRLENTSNPAEGLSESISTKNDATENLNPLKTANVEGNLNSNIVTEKSTSSPNNESVTSQNSYSLRSLKLKKTIFQTTPGQDNLDKELTRPSCRKNLFFSNLQLQKNKTNNTVSNEVQSSQNIESSEKVNNVSNVQANINSSSNEPKIIRNFVVCSEFEDRLKNNQMMMISDEFDDYDYAEDQMEVDYDDVDELSSNKSKVDITEFTQFRNQNIYHPVGQVHCSKDVVKINFTCFIKTIAQEIRDVSTNIYNFSTSYYEEISSEALVDKNDVRRKAEQTRLYIDKVCTALTSILRRDKDLNYNLKAVLNKTEFGNFYVDDDQMEAYGVFIENCLKHTYDLKRIIEDILSVVED